MTGQPENDLSGAEIRRYQRHLTLPEVGLEGQRRLRDSSALVVGAGGLGSPVALYLAAAGVGRLGLVDFDTVDESNLHRQIIHGTSDLGRSKLASATDRIREVNPHVRVEPFEVRMTADNALDLVADFDIVADGTDNFPTRYLVNDACVLTKTPNVYASIYRFEGQLSLFAIPDGPCYRCLYPDPPPPGTVPSCAEGGVLGVLPGIVGTLQAAEVLKHLLGVGEPLSGRLLMVDALGTVFRTLQIQRDPGCPVCGDRPTIDRLIDYDAFCAGPGPEDESEGPQTNKREAVPIDEWTVQELKARIDAGSRPFLLDVRQPFEDQLATIGADQLIPVEELDRRLGELRASADDDIVVHCRSGVRSARAVKLLRAAGYGRAVNLAGGILAWSDQVDPSVPRY